MGAREQMIDAAERLAVERGIGAMSLREVQAASGQRNKSAAQYHFGSREGLIDALVAARMGPINEHRRRLLDRLEAFDGDPPLRVLVEAVVEPLAEATLQPGSRWARFLLQGYFDPAVSSAVRGSFESLPYWDVRQRIAAAIDHVPEPLRQARLDQAMAAIVTTLAAAEGHTSPLDPAALVANLVDACVGLLAAPVSAVTASALTA